MHRNIEHLKIIAFADILIIVTILSVYFGFLKPENPVMGITFILFFTMLASVVIFWQHRIPILLLTIGIMFFLNIMSIDAFIKYAKFNVIAFLIGMMIVVAFLEEKGFFEVVLSLFLSKFGKNAKMFFVGLLLLSALSAAIVDEVTSILFMTTMVLKVTKKYNVSPVPYILSVVFATNVGSTFTVVGNPVGVMIAFEGNLSFIDFLKWSLPTGLLVLMITIGILLTYYRKEIRDLDRRMRMDHITTKKLRKASDFYKKFLVHREMWAPLGVFLLTIFGLMLHHPLEELLHLQPNSLLLGVPIFAAAISLIQWRGNSIEVIEKRIEWPTLVFFIFFFASVGALAYTNITGKIGEAIVQVTGGDMAKSIIVFIWLSGLLSAVMDNVLAVATLASVVSTLPTETFPLWWAILFGSCYMGNLTIIGSSANVIAVGKVQKERDLTITFWQWLKPGVIVAITQTFIAMLLTILLHVFLFPN
ncbi:MAG: SLC13 family permease [Thermoplasmata archaeon]|nr:SLC13 family permease [Thermoplasmata archaeon]